MFINVFLFFAMIYDFFLDLIISTSSTLLTPSIPYHFSPIVVTMAVLGSVLVVCFVTAVIVFFRRKSLLKEIVGKFFM